MRSAWDSRCSIWTRAGSARSATGVPTRRNSPTASRLSDYAHRHGLKFGLWADWAQAGTSTGKGALNVADPKVRDWLTTDPPPGWKPAGFKGITIDLESGRLPARRR